MSPPTDTTACEPIDTTESDESRRVLILLSHSIYYG